jgi:hypothetical protein
MSVHTVFEFAPADHYQAARAVTRFTPSRYLVWVATAAALAMAAWTAREVRDVGNVVRLDVPWRAITRALETDRFLLFFYNKQTAYYIPKRTLTPAQLSDARAHMRDALRERAVLQSA